MYEDDEFARSLRPTQNVDRGSRLFIAEDSDMMNMIFQYLEADGGAVKDVETKGTKAWEPPRLDFDPTLVADFQRYAEYNGSSQESSPSPSVSLFSESSSFNTNAVSGLTTPRSLSNSSSRSPTRTEQGDGLRMTAKPTDTLATNNKPDRSNPSPPQVATNSPTFENRNRGQDEVLPPPVTVSVRRHELRDPQEKGQDSYSDAHWPSLATIASQHERKGSRQNSYRHTMPHSIPGTMSSSGGRRDERDLAPAVRPSDRHMMQPSIRGTMASGARRDELDELAQAVRSTNFRNSSPPLESASRSQRTSHKVSPSPYQPVYSPETLSALTYEPKSSQNTFQTYRNPLPALSESSSQSVDPPYSPSNSLHHPKPPPTDPSLRRYESFKMSGASAGKYELRDPQGVIPVDEARNKNLDNLASPKPSLRSRFSFPKATRATITSFVDIMPHAPPSPAITPPGESTTLPTQLRIPTPDFSLPPRPPKKNVPAEPLPSALTAGKTRDTPDVHTTGLNSPSRSSSGKSAQLRSFTPSLTIQIPESTRPAPQKVDHDRPGLSDALNQFKQKQEQESILARPRPKPKTQEHVPIPMWEAPAPKPNNSRISRTSDSILARPRPKPQTQTEGWRASAPAPAPAPRLRVVNPDIVVDPPTIYHPAPTPTKALPELPSPKPKPKHISFDESTISPTRTQTYESSAPILPAPNFSRTAQPYIFDDEPNPQELQHAYHFESQTPISIPRPLNLNNPHSHSRTSSISSSSSIKAREKASAQEKIFNTVFKAPKTGLQLTMSRRVATFSKLEWAIESSSSSHTVKCFTQTNTLSRRTDFFDANSEEVCVFQRKTGSTRVGETSVGGRELFEVKNVSFGLCPFWVVEFPVGGGEEREREKERWVVRGDEALEGVSVRWGDREVGRIGVVERRGKHTYTVDAKAEINFAVMAALVTVFDDWRMDHAC